MGQALSEKDRVSSREAQSPHGFGAEPSNLSVLRLSCYRAFLLVLSVSRLLVYMFQHLSAGGLYANSLCCVHVCVHVCLCRPEVNHECSSGDISLVLVTHWPESHINLG